MPDFSIDIVALIGAIWLILRIVKLRAIAALPFARCQARFVELQPPAAIADLIDAANRQLDDLGFVPGRWMHVSEAESSQTSLRYVRIHPTEHCAIFLANPTLQAPNRLSAWFVARIHGGAYLISQSFDPYFAMLAGDRAIVQTLSEPSLAGQWSVHLGKLAVHGKADPAAMSDAALLGFCTEWFETQRQALIAKGDLIATSGDSARPSLSFAWRALSATLAAPKPPPEQAMVPSARVAMLAALVERQRARSPARRIEWSLFAISVGLFMALGALLWDPHMAFVILTVVIIHELGHFLAMRAFGYRNVHMMALPLVGGVAMGQDANPSAHRSAWMSLMGPLPGIVIGWLILIATIGGHWPAALGSGWMWATTFLLINYLNVIPVPPLDGGHVVQALLPPRRAAIEVGFIAIACLAGAALAAYAEFWILAALALLQLLALPMRWQAQRALAFVAANPPAEGTPRPVRLRKVADAIEGALGPTAHGKLRVEQTLDVLQRLDRKPMRLWQAALVASTMLFLLAVPIAAGWLMWTGAQGQEVAEQRAGDVEADRQRAVDAAAALSDAELLRGLAGDRARPPASEADIADAERRLGIVLPPDLKALYRQHDGLSALTVEPVSQLRYGADVVDRWFSYAPENRYPVDVLTPGGESSSESMSREYLREWLLLSTEDEWLTLYNPVPASTVQVVELFYESSSGYRSMRDWLEIRHQYEQTERAGMQRVLASQALAYDALATADWSTVLDALQPPLPVYLRLMASRPPVPPPATEAQLRAAEQRLGAALPADLRELLTIRNGVAQLGIGPVDAFAAFQPSDIDKEAWSMPHDDPIRWSGSTSLELDDLSELRGCWSLNADNANQVGLLCPPGHAHAGWIDRFARQRYASTLDYARSRAALVRANSQ